MLNNVAIIGSGSWATALVKIFSESGLFVSWLVRTIEQEESIRLNARNPRYLCDAELDINLINPTISHEEALHEAQLVIFAVPSVYLKDVTKRIDAGWINGKKIAVSIKGIVPNTGCTPSCFIKKNLSADQDIIVISGPSNAEEVATRRNTYLTVAGSNEKCLKELSDSLDVQYIRTVLNNDPGGVEYVAILKNIIGIASGIANGLNYGENFQAVLTSNAMREVFQLLNLINPIERDLFNSAYFGDMLVTAYSDFSRNRTLGKLIGRGMQVNQLLHAAEISAEGFHSSKELQPVIDDLNISLPILNGVYRILHEHANPFHEFKLIEDQLR